MNDGHLLGGPDGDLNDGWGQPAGDQKDPYARRHARQTRTFLTLVAVVLAIGAGGFLAWQGFWDLGGTGKPEFVACPAVTQTAAASARTRVNVYNASGQRGLAGAVAREMQLRGFKVPSIANDPLALQVSAAAQVRYGPSTVLQARTVAAQVNGEIELLLDEARVDDVVDLALGEAFVDMKPVPEALVQLAAPPAPSPQGCVRPEGENTPPALVTDPRPPTASPTPSPSPTS